MTYRLFSLLVLGLLALAAAPLSVAGEELPPADTVARWILAGDDTEVAKAIRALDGAPTSYLAEVVDAVRTGTQRSGVFPDEPPEIPFVPTQPNTVMIDLDVWPVPQGTTARLWDPSETGGTTLYYLDEAELATAHKTLMTLTGVTGNQGMSLLVADREEASLAVTEPVSFVEGYVGEDATGETPKVTPRVGTVHEGVTMSVRPVISGDGKYVTLEMYINHLAVQRPIPKSTVEVGKNGQEIEIEAPVIAESPSRVTVRIPRGCTVALTGFRDQRTPYRELIAFVRATIPSGNAPPELPARPETDLTFVNLEARVLSVARKVATRVLGDRIPDAHDTWRLLEPKEVLGLLGREGTGAQGVKILAAPRLTTYDGQAANVSILSQTSYVKDFEVVKKDGQTILHPIVDTIQDGLVLEVTPRIADDPEEGIDADVRTTWAELSRPIAEFTTMLHGKSVTIQLPELLVARSRAECSVPPGGYVLLGGLGEGDEGPRFVLLHASLVAQDGLPDAPPPQVVPVTPR